MYREEVDALKKVIAIKPEMGYAYMELGTACNRLGQYRDAIENLQKAKKFLPQYAVIYNNLAVTYGKIGKVDEEIGALKKAISLRPRYTTARYNLGVVSLKKGERGEALKQLSELKKFDEGAPFRSKKRSIRYREKAFMIELNQLSKTYTVSGKVIKAVQPVDITIQKGEFVSIVGHSGSGKSTFLSLVGGIARPDTGSVVIDGVNIRSYNDRDSLQTEK